MPKAKSTWQVRKHRIVGEISYIRIIDQAIVYCATGEKKLFCEFEV